MAKAIMVQGVCSGAGKSLLVAGLCRILKQDGYRVAPFKSQNMALNSFITRQGLEMGRAQVVQAEAAGIEPTVNMNPILLKPQSDTGSQVIVGGEVYGVMPAMEYFRRKKEFVPQIKAAYESLSNEYDMIVLEGAGSPAEINLKENDIVNMGMARMARAPVLLVGDIDRGGVFASLAGTLQLLEDEERAMVKGLIINKFRGDRAILEPGLKMLEELVHVPVTGVVPYLHVQIDEEDSMTSRFDNANGPGLLDIAVPRLPRISNFTDLSALEVINGVRVRYVTNARVLGSPDLIVLPGSKNTMEDLLWLRQCGLESAILKFAHAGGLVLGICGGYQMLGESLSDPDGVERGGELEGMGLLPVHTVFSREKVRTRVHGQFCAADGEFAALSGAPIEGYEIHMGRTTSASGARPLCAIAPEDSAIYDEGCSVKNVCGCYVHGLFDREEAARAFIELLCRRKGMDPGMLEAVDMAAFKQQQYDLLADGLRASLDMDSLYNIIQQGL